MNTEIFFSGNTPIEAAILRLRETYGDYPGIQGFYEMDIYDDDGKETGESLIVADVEKNIDFMIKAHIIHLAKPFDIEFET